MKYILLSVEVGIFHFRNLSIEAINSFYNKQKDDNLCFVYQGEFSDNMTDRILSMSEYNLDNLKSLSKLKKKVSFLMAESFQNIIRHGDIELSDPDISPKTGLFLTRNIGNMFYIISANIIDNTQIPDLNTKLNSINTLSPVELKALYMDVLSNQELSSKGGAGLGLIEMARKSGQKLDYEFEPVDTNHSLFYLGIKLKGESEEEFQAEQISIKDALDFHHQMEDNNILMSYKGDFSQSSFMPILKMVEENLEIHSEHFSTRKRVFLALLEISQNISAHSKRNNNMQEGILMIGKQNDHYTISAGNYINKSSVSKIKNQLDLLNTLNKEELRGLYQDTLKLSDEGSEGSGLGLIDIARDSSSKISYSFTPIDDDTVLFSFNIIYKF